MKTCFPKSLKTNEKICFKTVDRAVFDDKGVPLSDRLNTITQNVNTSAADIVTTNARIDNLAATVQTLSEDGTTPEFNTEIVDMRVGHDGTIYNTAGTAIRTQLTKVYDTIKEIIRHTREVVPRDMDIYTAMYLHDDETMLYTDYVKFAYPTSVSVPHGYKVAVHVYTYDESTHVFTEEINSGWVTKYPIPKNKYVVIKLKHQDDSNILETESIALMFKEEYPDLIKNDVLNSIGFYDALEYRTPSNTEDTFNPSVISTDMLLSSPTALFVKAKAGYKCNVIIYKEISEGTYSVMYDNGWQSEYLIPAGNIFTFAFAKETDTDILYFDEFVNNFYTEEIDLNNSFLNNIVRSLSYHGVIHQNDGYLHYEDTMNTFMSGTFTVTEPTTIYLDYNSNYLLAYHIPFVTDPEIVEYDSYVSKILTIPAGNNIRLYFARDDWSTPNIKDLFTIKATSDPVESIQHSHIKSIAHRGLSRYAPENTLHAYRFAKLHGFKYVECDVHFTSDDIPVLMSTADISLTSNGTGILTNMTYNDLYQYDYGFTTKFGPAFKNTKILKFEEFILLCRNTGLNPYIELTSYETEEHINAIYNIVKKYGIIKNVTWISYDWNVLNALKTIDTTARLGLIISDSITEDSIQRVNALKTATNEVFINMNYIPLTDSMVTLCIDNSVPLEVNVVDDVAIIESLNPYISGVTSNWLQADKYLIRKDI